MCPVILKRHGWFCDFDMIYSIYISIFWWYHVVLQCQGFTQLSYEATRSWQLHILYDLYVFQAVGTLGLPMEIAGTNWHESYAWRIPLSPPFQWLQSHPKSINPLIHQFSHCGMQEPSFPQWAHGNWQQMETCCFPCFPQLHLAAPSLTADMRWWR